jgi:hypothetical protein
MGKVVETQDFDETCCKGVVIVGVVASLLMVAVLVFI